MAPGPALHYIIPIFLGIAALAVLCVMQWWVMLFTSYPRGLYGFSAATTRRSSSSSCGLRRVTAEVSGSNPLRST